MTTESTNLDDFRFESGQNVQGFLGLFTGYEENKERAASATASGRSSGFPVDFGFAKPEIYRANYPIAINQYVISQYVNQEAQSGAWFEFADSIKQVYRGDTRFAALKGKWFNCRYMLVMSRSNVAGEWVDRPMGRWKVLAVADTLDGARLPDDDTWQGTDSTGPNASGGLFDQAVIAKATESAPAISVPATTTPATATTSRDELILELANGSNEANFQKLCFQDSRATDIGLDDEVMNTSGVGVLAPFVESGQLAKDETGVYRRTDA